MSAYDVYCRLGSDRITAGDVSGAVKPLRVAYKLEPTNPDICRVLSQALFILGEQHRLAGQIHEAHLYFDEAVRCSPDYAVAWNGLGQCQIEEGAISDGVASFRRALASAPDAAIVHSNLGNALVRDLEFDAADTAYLRALELAPDDAEIRHNYSMHLLRTGRLAEGWRMHRARLDRPGRMPPIDGPLWDGGDLAGRTIAVWSEQGIGDELMFGTCMPDLIARTGHVIWEVSSKIAPLCRRSFPQATVIARSDGVDGATTTAARFPWRAEAGTIDVWTGSGLLPGFFRPDRESFAGSGGYLKADPVRRQEAASWMAGLPRPRVGFCWRSGHVTARRGLTYAPPEALAAVARDGGIAPVLLQHGIVEQELAAFDQAGVPIAAMPGLDLFDDLEGTAGLVAELDLVISAGTSIAELAGALGVPVWRFGPQSDWTLLGYGVAEGYQPRARPWFGSMQVFLKPDAQADWLPLFHEINTQFRGNSSALG